VATEVSHERRLRDLVTRITGYQTKLSSGLLTPVYVNYWDRIIEIDPDRDLTKLGDLLLIAVACVIDPTFTYHN
jgi:hypothetical protein